MMNRRRPRQGEAVDQAQGQAKKKLNDKGKAKVKAEVTFTPDGGSPNTEDKKIKLVEAVGPRAAGLGE